MMKEEIPAYAFPKQRSSVQEVFPSPEEGSTAYENPPAFVWLTPSVSQDQSITYQVTIKSSDHSFILKMETQDNVCLPEEPLPMGEFLWDVEAKEMGCHRGWQHFRITEESVIFHRPTVEKVLEGIPLVHPRHLFEVKDLEQIRKAHGPELAILKRNIQLAYEEGMPERPMFHKDPQALPYREYFGRFRDFCDRNLVACALGSWLLEEEAEREKAGEFAKELFLTLCDWNPFGPCALFEGGQGDEIGLSMARCLPAAFDLVYPRLTPAQRTYGAETVATYARQCENRINKINYTRNPGDSHVGRLPAYLGEAALVLWKLPEHVSVTEEELKRWLGKALTIYNTMFPYYGSEDGGWAEGTFYSTSYTRWYLPFFNLVARFSGSSYFVRPFYRNYARYLLHFALPDHEVHPFGDGYWCYPESPEWPGFFAQNPFGVYADLSGLEEAKNYARKNLDSIDFFRLHLLDLFLPLSLPNLPASAPATNADAFLQTGVLSLHTDRTVPENDLHLMARASRFASGSHRQPDQGSFALFYGGTVLLSPSGYFGRRYGSLHHRQWYNHSKAHNTILVDGEGQHFGNHLETGTILSCEEHGGIRTASMDLSASYPMLKYWIRTITMTTGGEVEIKDEIEAHHPVNITECFHMYSKPEIQEVVDSGEMVDASIQVLDHAGSGLKKQKVVEERKGVTLEMSFVGEGTWTLSDTYDVDLNEGEPEAYHVTMPQQYHAYYQTEKKEKHCLICKINVKA